MAAGGGDFQTVVRESLLVCQVCREDFSLDGRPPRLLPCFHCFCQPCLARLEEESAPLRCPQCRRSFAPGDKWPLDTTRTTLLELPGRGGGGEGGQGRSCQGCSQSAPAQSWCQHCSQALCQSCCQAHGILNVFRGHTLVPLEEAAEAATRSAQAAEKCHKHKSKKLKFYCRDCVEPVCSTCAILLHSGHKMAELEAALEEKRKEVEEWCQKVEVALPDFQERAASSGARLQTMDIVLQDRVSQVQTLFSRVVSKVMDRQEQVLTDLRAKVKGQRLELEGQHCSDQSRVEAARAMAEHGRRVTSLGLPTQLIGQPQKMEEAFGAVQESGEATVKTSPALVFLQGEMPALTTALEGVGLFVELPFVCPDFQLSTGPHSKTSVDGDVRSLTNEKLSAVGRKMLTRSKMIGALTSAAAPDTTCYWQVLCQVTPRHEMKNVPFCEVGVGKPSTLTKELPEWYIPLSTSTVVLERSFRHLRVATTLEEAASPDTNLLMPWPKDGPLEFTMGFLLDRSGHRLHVIDVAKARVLESREVKVDALLWPVLCVRPKEKIRADVRLELQSGAKMNVSDDLFSVLESLVNAQ